MPADLRSAMLPDLPANIVLSPGRLEIAAPTAMKMLESLVALAMVMQNDLGRFRDVIEPQQQPTGISEDKYMAGCNATGVKQME